ncbi:MAG: hypothetical protein H6Q90_1491 [Deltaproteobacteria bacterium]|nr:hypothetical protein [Deltaproteobacteria bacterium]
MRCLALVIGLVIASGCVTPSIPIPPPDPAKMTFVVSEGPPSQATFSYLPDANYADTIVYLFNRDRGVGIIESAHPDGSVGPTAPLAAALGEQIIVSFQRDDQTLASRCIRLRNGIQDATDCGP